MADLPTHPDANGDTGDDTSVGSGRGSDTGTPRWVMIAGIITLIVVLLFVIMMLVGGGGGHGPGRHTAPSGVTVHSVQRP